MTFWNAPALAPKRNYRWQLSISGFTGHTIVWWAKSVTMPSFDVSETEHNWFDNKFYYPGRVSWSEVEATLVDPVSPDAVGLTLQALEASGYNVAGNKNPKDTISKSGAATGLGTVTITVYGPDADAAIETWTLQNAFIKAAKFGDMDYSNDELRSISLTIRYDWATVTNTATETDGGVSEIFKAISS